MSHREVEPNPDVLSRAQRADVAGARPTLVAGAGAAFTLVAALVGADVLSDTRSGGSSTHAALELAIMGVAVAAAAFFGWAFLTLRRRARRLAGDLGAAQAEAEQWRREAEDVLRGLGEAMERQFDRWKLSSAEREVALLLLKGLAHKEIAEVRQTSERTVRQQSLALYRKAGLSGRAELSAFFLEDLLLPSPRARSREG